jgi:alkylation response protein AidB-like acyl-CoA dehydrogenase
LLQKIAAAEVVIALAVDEASKHKPAAIVTKAERDRGGFRLNGAKTFVLDGHVADQLIVAARTSERGLTLFLVDPRAAGVHIERTLMVDAHNAARVRFEGVDVDAGKVLGLVDGAGPVLDEVLDLGRAVVAAQLLGAANEVFDRTLAYLKERKQFDRYIGEFQALQHRAAELYIDIELTRAMVLGALQAMDQAPATAGLIVAQAKAHACTTANRAVQEGVQMHGGMGMTDEFDIGLFMKRVRTLQELFGDAGFHADRVAAMNGY